MSMPKFPEIDPEITCERALNMILASIAMEEAAISHIVNAEGEKIQYVLGTLETSSKKEPDVEEILRVNQSVTCLMDSISQYQMILKDKMDKALHAHSEICPKSPKPSCICPGKCSATFKAAEKCKLWHPGFALHWNTEHRHGKSVCHDPCDKTKIELCTKGRFMVSFSVNVRAKGCQCNTAISFQMIKNHQRSELYVVRGHIPCADETITISMDGIIVENFDHACSLLFKLESPDSLIVEDSMLSIVEI